MFKKKKNCFLETFLNTRVEFRFEFLSRERRNAYQLVYSHFFCKYFMCCYYYSMVNGCYTNNNNNKLPTFKHGNIFLR